MKLEPRDLFYSLSQKRPAFCQLQQYFFLTNIHRIWQVELWKAECPG